MAHYDMPKSVLHVITSLPTIYVIIIGLALLDVGTTRLASISLGRHFAELGVISNFFIHTFPLSWPYYAYASEIAIFSLTTLAFSLLWKNKSFQLLNWKIPLAHLPVIALIALVLNNSAVVIVFRLSNMS